MKSLLIISFLSLTVFALGQGKAEKDFTQFFENHELDTFLIVKTGCRTCEISYVENIKTLYTITIYLLYKKYGQIALVTYSDTGQTFTSVQIRSDIFKYIEAKRNMLEKADNYYKELKLSKFQAPCLTSYPYEKIDIQIGHFRHKHTLVDREMDDFGTNLTREEWFKAELEILALVDLTQ